MPLRTNLDLVILALRRQLEEHGLDSTFNSEWLAEEGGAGLTAAQINRVGRAHPTHAFEFVEDDEDGVPQLVRVRVTYARGNWASEVVVPWSRTAILDHHAQLDREVSGEERLRNHWRSRILFGQDGDYRPNVLTNLSVQDIVSRLERVATDGLGNGFIPAQDRAGIEAMLERPRDHPRRREVLMALLDEEVAYLARQRAQKLWCCFPRDGRGLDPYALQAGQHHRKVRKVRTAWLRACVVYLHAIEGEARTLREALAARGGVAS